MQVRKRIETARINSETEDLKKIKKKRMECNSLLLKFFTSSKISQNFATAHFEKSSREDRFEHSVTPSLKKFRADWVFFEHRASDRDLIDRIPKKSAKGTLAGTPLVLYIYI